MNPLQSLINRNIGRITHPAWLVALPPGLNGCELQESMEHYTTWDAGTALRWQAQRAVLGWQEPDTACSHLIVFFSKAKAEMSMLIDLATNYLQRNGGGILWVLGSNDGGIKSFATMAKKNGLSARKIDAARHGALFECEIAPDQTSMVLKPEDFLTLDDKSGPMILAGLPGVFSFGRLDKGTELLLKHLPKIKGRVLDFGCGNGAIGSHLLSADPDTQIDFVDINWLATTACQKTMEQNNYPNTQIFCQDGLIGLPMRYRHIISNPPFHEGKKTDYSAAERFLMSAKDHLLPNGNLTIVANDFLNYEGIITAAFGNCNTLAREKGFKILSSTKNR